MSQRPLAAILPILAALSPMAAPAQDTPKRVSISVKEADLKDILRAVTEGTTYNLTFEPGLNTRLQGLDLKEVTLEEILTDILPTLGLDCSRQGRTLFIHKADERLKFYHVNQLAMKRTGSKSFTVNASGQTIQTSGGASGGSGGGQGGASGSSSAYTSSLDAGTASDPWAELESGLAILVFGAPAELAAAPDTGGGRVAAPASRGYRKDDKSLLIQPNSGLVIVSADPATHRRVDAYLKETARRNQRQVLLEARIVEVTLGNDSQVGVDWNGLLTGTVASPNPNASSFATGTTLDSNVGSGQGLLKLVAQSGRVRATLSALARDNRLKVLSSPRLSTLNNQKAILRVVREEAYFLTTTQVTPGGSGGGAIATVQITPMIVPVGIVLDIQPQVGDDGFITLAVNPSISEVVTERDFIVAASGNNPGGQAKLPVVDRRDLDAVVRLRSGETLVLAGIIHSKEGVDDRGVPWVRKLPFIGNFFTKKEKTSTRTELAIFISPTLMEDSQQLETQFKDAEHRLGGAEQAASKGSSSLKTP